MNKENLKLQTENKMNDIELKLEKIKNQITKESGDAQVELKEKHTSFKNKKNDLEMKYNEFKKDTEVNWTSFKTDVQNKLNEMSNEIDRIIK